MQENSVFWPYFDFGLPSIFARKIQENSGAGGRASGMALQISPEVQNTLGEVRRDLQGPGEIWSGFNILQK